MHDDVKDALTSELLLERLKKHKTGGLDQHADARLTFQSFAEVRSFTCSSELFVQLHCGLPRTAFNQLLFIRSKVPAVGLIFIGILIRDAQTIKLCWPHSSGGEF